MLIGKEFSLSFGLEEKNIIFMRKSQQKCTSSTIKLGGEEGIIIIWERAQNDYCYCVGFYL